LKYMPAKAISSDWLRPRIRIGLCTDGCAAKLSESMRSCPRISLYCGMSVESVVKTLSKSFADSMKSSKCDGSSLFQNTVGMECSLQYVTNSTMSLRGACEPVSWYCHAPSLPAQADSTNSMSIGSWRSSSRQPLGVTTTVSNSGVHARMENSSRMTPT